MIVLEKDIRNLKDQKQFYAQELFQSERLRLQSQLDGLRAFESCRPEDFSNAQKDYFDLLADTNYTENTGIVGPLSILLKLEEAVTSMITEYMWCKNVMRNMRNADMERGIPVVDI